VVRSAKAFVLLLLLLLLLLPFPLRAFARPAKLSPEENHMRDPLA